MLLCLTLLLICSSLQVYATGPLLPNTVFVTNNYTVSSTDVIIFVDTSSQAVTVTLPATSAALGRTLSIVDFGGNAGTNFITIQCDGSDIINGNGGSGTWVLPANGIGLQLYSGGGTGVWFHWSVQ